MTGSNSDICLKRFNPIKAGLFEGSFLWGGEEGGQFDPPVFIFQEELI